MEIAQAVRFAPPPSEALTTTEARRSATAAKVARAVAIVQRCSQAKTSLRCMAASLPASTTGRAVRGVRYRPMRTTRTTRDGREPTPVVPLEAGAGPDNPPCPACGEPLFGWIDARPGLAGPVSAARAAASAWSAAGDLERPWRRSTA